LAYDEDLDARVACALLPNGAIRKPMFGGVCYLLNGNMVGGVHRDRLILRLGEEGGVAALEQPFVVPFDITGRPMRGWVMVEPDGLDDQSLDRWLNQAHTFASSLPAK
jgi:hypothetical protein